MSSMAKRIWRYIWGPNVHRRYNVRTNETNAVSVSKFDNLKKVKTAVEIELLF